MRILFDQGTPVPLRDVLFGHSVETAFERGWSQMSNGELLEAAETAGFEVSSRPIRISDINRICPFGESLFSSCRRRAGRKFNGTPGKSRLLW